MKTDEVFDEAMDRARRAVESVPSMVDEVLRGIGGAEAAGRRVSPERMPRTLSERITHMHRAVKVAAALVAALALVATGWAAEKVYEAIQGRPVRTKLEAMVEEEPIVLSDGRTVVGVTTVGTMTTADGTGATGVEEQQIDALIRRGEYRLMREVAQANGETVHVYAFTLGDGRVVHRAFATRLDEVTSMADYREKQASRLRARHRAIREAVAKGDYRLLDVEPLLVHLCTDVASGREIEVQRIDLPDGRTIALARDAQEALRSVSETDVSYETDWEAHLEAVRGGRRTLRGARIVRRYTYEVTLADGTSVRHSYGGDLSLDEMGKLQGR